MVWAQMSGNGESVKSDIERQDKYFSKFADMRQQNMRRNH